MHIQIERGAGLHCILPLGPRSIATWGFTCPGLALRHLHHTARGSLEEVWADPRRWHAFSLGETGAGSMNPLPTQGGTELPGGWGPQGASGRQRNQPVLNRVQCFILGSFFVFLFFCVFLRGERESVSRVGGGRGWERLVWEVARIAHPIRSAAASVSNYRGAGIGPNASRRRPRPTSAHGALGVRPFAPGLKPARPGDARHQEGPTARNQLRDSADT